MVYGLLFWPFFFWGPFHGLGSLIILLIVLGLIFGRRRYYYGYHPWNWPHPGNSRSEALSVLEARYARGEIQREEYLQKKQDLGG